MCFGTPNQTRAVNRQRRKVLCELLVQCREHASLTQAAVARRLARSRTFVSRYERCKRRLDLVEFMEVCHVLGCVPAVLVSAVSRRVPAPGRPRRGGR